jgi:hypothetical protein
VLLPHSRLLVLLLLLLLLQLLGMGLLGQLLLGWDHDRHGHRHGGFGRTAARRRGEAARALRLGGASCRHHRDGCRRPGGRLLLLLLLLGHGGCCGSNGGHLRRSRRRRRLLLLDHFTGVDIAKFDGGLPPCRLLIRQHQEGNQVGRRCAAAPES